MWQLKDLWCRVFGCVANKGVRGEAAKVWQGKDLTEKRAAGREQLWAESRGRGWIESVDTWNKQQSAKVGSWKSSWWARMVVTGTTAIMRNQYSRSVKTVKRKYESFGCERVRGFKREMDGGGPQRL